MGAGTSRPRKFWVARGEHGDETSPPPREGGSDPDDADDTDKKAPEGMAAEMALSGPTTLPAQCGVSLIREIREIRGPFFGRSRVCRPPRLCAPQLSLQASR